MQFSKMHALGNDFVIVDAITQNIHFTSDIVCRLSDRHYGIGFDQLLIVEPPHDHRSDFHYRIFNSNGNEVSQCGNGIRCFGIFVRMKNLINKNYIRVSTDNRHMIISIINDNLVSVNMGEPNFNPQEIPFITNKFKKTYILYIKKKILRRSCFYR